MSTNVVVIGAGVIGLTTALLLQRKGYRVTIVAKYVPGDMNIEYTSPYSGAHWRTMSPNDNPELQRKYYIYQNNDCKWLSETLHIDNDATAYGIFWNIAEQLPSNETGVMIIPALDCFNERNDETANPWWKSVVKDFRFAESHELYPGTVIGHCYQTVTINTPLYMTWLLKLFIKGGGQLKKDALSHVHGALRHCPDAQAIINCTGLQARYLGGVKDLKVFPTRGQVVVVNAPHIKKTLTQMIGDETTYVIPRSNGHVVLGGTRQANNFDGAIDQHTADSIIERTLKLLPELSHGKGKDGLEIVRHSAGLRPTREGGPRVENEITNTPGNKRLLITHCYGHGGFGVQSSWGAAKKAVDLVTHGLGSPESVMIDSIVNGLWSKL
ncbi:hypothetical protein INT43_005921 [Umbelopsis isabellina]|uniref:FAD dependent oxidoreductase domain-containing protein n=1 Tax=Mortierella isabellina TaxID=91625 RepID=A0A8H7PJW2_MORIS|nr:hypothetical protein INT43_005921 [Umbelopsis isabellina]